MHKISVIVPFAVAALLAGCGSSSSSSSPSRSATASGAPPNASTGSALTLSESEFKISPATLSAAKAGAITITVKNTGAITHALAVQTSAGVVKTGPIAPGASATLTVNAAKPGRLAFYCPIANHRQLGMNGVLIVGGGGGGGGSSAPAPAASNSPY